MNSPFFFLPDLIPGYPGMEKPHSAVSSGAEIHVNKNSKKLNDDMLDVTNTSQDYEWYLRNE